MNKIAVYIDKYACNSVEYANNFLFSLIFILLALWVIFIDFPSLSSNSLAPQQVHKVLIRDTFLDSST